MTCQYLIGRQIKMCGAFKGAVVLSVEELESVCGTEQYHNCKVYKKYCRKGVKLPLHEYTQKYVLPSV